MPKLRTALFAAWMFLPGSIWATEPVDSQVRSALADIAKYENQLAGQTSANAVSVKRSLKLLTITRQRLDSSPNKSDPSWIEADERYNALVARLNQLLSPRASATALSSAPPIPTASAQPQAAASAATSGARPQMISQYRVRIKKIIRDIDSRYDTLDKGGIKPFQDAEYVRQFEQNATSFGESIGRYADFPDDPDVIAAKEALARFEKLIAFGREQAAKDLAQLGNVQQRLASIDERIRGMKQPPAPQEPYGDGQLGQWLTQLARLRQEASKTYQPLPEIKERAYLPLNPGTVQEGAPYDMNDVIRMERAILGLVDSIDTELKRFSDQLQLVVDRIAEGLNFYSTFDPSDPDAQANHFLSQGRADEIRRTLAKDRQTVAEAAHYAQLLNDPSYDECAKLLQRVQATADQYEANYRKARELIRMPEAATTEPKLTAIAEKTLAGYDYVGNIKRMVINTEKTHRSKDTSEERYDDIDVSLSGTITLTGTKTTYHYEWDQFQVATAEPVDGKYYIFYNTLKYFTSGSATTPLNKWIIGSRFQGPEIPEENINR